MFDCVAVGDSIAVGVGHAMHCTINAKVGASSSYIANHTIASSKDVAVISAGSNDPDNPKLSNNLKTIRSKLKTGRVIWILPYNRKAAAVVLSVAKLYGDSYIDLGEFKTKDSVHPQNYKAVVKKM
jgi:hypothetical protein